MDGKYNKFKKPKQLLEVNGEVLVERTIRLLKENGIEDIAISTNNPAFDYLDIEKLRHQNGFICNMLPKDITSQNSWLNAYYSTEEPCCYLHGDVYYSDEAIKKIINTKVKDTMFFCIADLQDGRKAGINAKGREPLAYKVENQKVFRKAINELLEMIDEGKFKYGVEPISWHLYRQINGFDLGFNAKDYGYANGIFDTVGDYIVINDYTTDVDSINDIPRIEQIIKIINGGEKMIKVIVKEQFYLGRFNELMNIERKNPNKNRNGDLFVGDTFECTQEMFEYLTEKNKLGRAFVEMVEIIPDKKIVEEEKVEDIEKKLTTRRRKRSVAKD